MARKRVFGKVRFTREERARHRRIREATRDRPSLREVERRLGPFERFETLEELDASRLRAAIGHKIGVAREDAGLTQEELAKLVGTERANISRLETGAEDITINTLARVARVLKLKLTVEPAEPAEKKPAGDGARG